MTNLKLPTYVCLPNKQASKRYFCDDAYGQGSSLNTTVAKLKSIAEFLERLAISNPKETDLIKQEYVADFCANPELFVHYSDAQIKQNKNLKNSIYLWSSASDCLNKMKVLVPSQTVYLSDIFRYETLIKVLNK